MTIVLGLLIMLGGTAQAHPVTATIEQQVEIMFYAWEAKQSLDPALYAPGQFRTAYGKALNQKEELEKLMGLRDDQGNLLKGKSPVPTEEDLKKISGGWKWWKDRRQEYAEAAKLVQETEARAERNYQKALDLAVLYYNLSFGPLSH